MSDLDGEMGYDEQRQQGEHTQSETQPEIKKFMTGRSARGKYSYSPLNSSICLNSSHIFLISIFGLVCVCYNCYIPLFLRPLETLNYNNIKIIN